MLSGRWTMALEITGRTKRQAHVSCTTLARYTAGTRYAGKARSRRGTSPSTPLDPHFRHRPRTTSSFLELATSPLFTRPPRALSLSLSTTCAVSIVEGHVFGVHPDDVFPPIALTSPHLTSPQANGARSTHGIPITHLATELRGRLHRLRRDRADTAGWPHGDASGGAGVCSIATTSVQAEAPSSMQQGLEHARLAP